MASLTKKSIIFLYLLTMLSACTYSINMIHTQGEAEDIVDETQKADADVKPTLSVPPV